MIIHTENIVLNTQIARSFELLKLVHSAGTDAIKLDAKISSIIVIE